MQKIQFWMMGRNRADSLYRFSMVMVFILLFISIIFRLFNLAIVSLVFRIVAIVVCIYALFRYFSKNLVARQRENSFYVRTRNALTSKCAFQKQKWTDRKNYIYKKCPECKAMLRLPRIKGKHNAVCPRCQNHFGVRIYFSKKNK